MKDFEEIYRRYFRDVYLYVYALSKDKHLSEDITSETFTRAMSSLRTFRGDCDIRVWLCQIAKNTYISHCRKNKRLVPLSEVSIEFPERFEEQIEDTDLARRIDAFVQRMEEPYRQVFVLRTYFELPYARIAAGLGRTESWARVTYTRAKQKIQKWIKEGEHA